MAAVLSALVAGCVDRARDAFEAVPVTARIAREALGPRRVARLLAGVSGLTTTVAASASAESWSVPGAAIRVRTATVAADGEGAWQVRIVADVVGSSAVPTTLDERRLRLMGATEAVVTWAQRPIRLRGGDSVRREFVWRQFATERPTRAQLVWSGGGGESPVRSIDLAPIGAIPPWTRALRSTAPSPLRLAVGAVEEIASPYAQLALRLRVTITNRGEEPIELTRSSFTLRVQSPREETLAPVSTASGYNPSLALCEAGATMLPAQQRLRPGETFQGAICFTRAARDHVSLVEVALRRDDRLEFTGLYPVTG
jgi:hypothetical protein